MKKPNEIGLEVIELEDQVLLVDSKWKYKNKELSIHLDTISIKSSATLSGWFGIGFIDNHKEIIASTKQHKGLPLLVIEDDVDNLGEDHTNIRILQHNTSILDARQYFDGFKDGYNKAKETYKFTEEDLKKILEFWGDRGRYDKEGFTCSFEKWWEQIGKDSIESLTKKELWVEVETELDAYYRNGLGGGGRFPKITNDQIKGVWK